MGIYDREYYRDEPQGFSLERLTGGRSTVVTLIILNVLVFVGDGLFAQSPPSRFLCLYETDWSRPWFWFRFVSYGFAHADAQHILFNMIGLYFFGRAIESLLGARTFLWMYLTALLVGSLVWMIGVQAVPSGLPMAQALLGASGGVVATIVLFCFLCPNQRVLFMMFIPMPAWVLGVLIVASDFYGSIYSPSSNVAFTVHLAGAVYAFIFYKTRWDISKLFPSNLVGVTRTLKPRPNLRVHRPEPEVDDTLAARADEVLRKLHEKGEASLTAAERKVLEEYSRRVKQRR